MTAATKHQLSTEVVINLPNRTKDEAINAAVQVLNAINASRRGGSK